MANARFSIPAHNLTLRLFGAALVSASFIVAGCEGRGAGAGERGPTRPVPIRPVIESIEPDSVPAGELVTISGQDFVMSSTAPSAAATSVTISNRQMDIESITPTRIVARVPLTVRAGSNSVRVFRDSIMSEPARLQVETFLVTGDFSGSVTTEVNSCPEGDPVGSTPQMTVLLTDVRPDVTAVVDGRTLDGSLTVGPRQVDVDATVVEGDRTFTLDGRVSLNENDHREFSGVFIESRGDPACEIRYRIEQARVEGP